MYFNICYEPFPWSKYVRFSNVCCGTCSSRALPEALSSIVTIVLAIGTQKLSKENATIKNLKSVEALGCVGVICSDKTGTLTQNKMTVKKVYVSGRVLEDGGLDSSREAENIILKESVLCNDATTEVGDQQRLL